MCVEKLCCDGNLYCNTLKKQLWLQTMVRLAFKTTALFAHQYKLILYKLILFYMMICGSGTETTMDLCGSMRAPLIYSSSWIRTSSPKTETFSIRTYRWVGKNPVDQSGCCWWLWFVWYKVVCQQAYVASFPGPSFLSLVACSPRTQAPWGWERIPGSHYLCMCIIGL